MLDIMVVKTGLLDIIRGFRIFREKVDVILEAESLKGKRIQKELEALKTKF